MITQRMSLLSAVIAAGLGPLVLACGDNVQGSVCGEGTVDVDGTCVVDDLPLAPPSIAAIDPVEDLVGGGAVFTLTGTGFRGTTQVMFGAAPAAFTITSDTQITGTVPRGLAKDVNVQVTNSKGSDEIAFAYLGIYGAQGTGLAGNLYLLDPRDGTSLTIGAIRDAANVGYAITGMEFDATGVLYATQATRDGSLGPASLLTIDPDTGLVTVIGPLDLAAVNYGSIGDVTFSGGTLLGWAERGNRALGDDLVSIDKATGAVTIVGDSALTTYGGALVTLQDGSVRLAGKGAGGPTHTINTTTGAATASVTLTGPSHAGVCAATRFRGQLYTMLCYGAHLLATVDAATGAFTPVGFPVGGIDALASDEMEATARRPAVQPVGPAAATAFAAMGCAQSGDASTSVNGIAGELLRATTLEARADVRVTVGRNPEVPALTLGAVLGAIGAAETIEIVPCTGAPLQVPASTVAAQPGELVLVANQRGQLKLVDGSGRTLLRDIIGVHAR